MPRFLAVDWDAHEVRFVFGDQAKEKLTVLNSASAPLEKTVAEDGTVKIDVGSVLLRLLKERRVGSAKTLFAVNSASAEIMYFTLPPSKNEEIPELLKNQAIRELPNFFESHPLDFLPFGEIPTEPRKLLAVSINKSQQKSLQSIGKAAHCKPAKLELRGAGVAALYRYSGLPGDDAPPVLLVNILVDELDLVVLAQNRIVYLRSVKLPDDPDPKQKTRRIVGEINRTLTIGLQDTPEEDFGNVVLFGGENEHADLLESLRSESLNVEILDPFSLPHIKAKETPTRSGRYAALLGMILCEAPGRKPEIDLLHPKSKPMPPNYAGIAALAILLLGLLLGVLWFWNSSVLKGLEQHRTAAEKAYQEQYLAYQQLSQPYTVLSNAKTLDTQDANWLDVMRDITDLFPEQQDMIVTQIRLVSGPINPARFGYAYSGQINVTAMVRDASVIQQLKEKLEAKRLYQMSFPNPVFNPSGGGYPWTYNFSIACIRVPDPATYLYFLPEELKAQSLQPPEFYPQPQQQVQPPPQPVQTQTEPQPVEPQPVQQPQQ